MMTSTDATDASRRTRKKAERREAIYQTAFRLFTERGFDAVSVEEIAEAVDIAKGTFFNYFSTKEQILVEYRHAIYDELLAFAQTLRGTSGRALFRKFSRYRARILEREGKRYLMLHRSLDARQELRAQGQDRCQQVLQLHIRYARLAVEAGEIAAGTDVKLFAEMVLDLFVGNLITWVSNPNSYRLEKRILQKIDFLFQNAS